MKDELQRLEAVLQELLTALDCGEPAALASAWERCEEAHRVLDARIAGAIFESPEERDRLRDGLERVLRLNAVARGAALDMQGSLGEDLAQVRLAAEQLRAYRGPAGPAGGSCDLAG